MGSKSSQLSGELGRREEPADGEKAAVLKPIEQGEVSLSWWAHPRLSAGSCVLGQAEWGSV